MEIDALDVLLIASPNFSQKLYHSLKNVSDWFWYNNSILQSVT